MPLRRTGVPGGKLAPTHPIRHLNPGAGERGAVFDPGGQTHRTQQVQERFGIELFDIDHGLGIPNALGHQDGGGGGRHPGGIADGLGFHFLVARRVVADVVDEDFLPLPVLLALHQRADAGVAGVALGQGGRIGQNGLEDLERHDFDALGGLDGFFGQHADVLQNVEHVDVMVAESHPEPDALRVNVAGQGMDFVVARQIDRLGAHDGEIKHPFLVVDGTADPLAVDPGPRLGELAEVDFRIEVGREILAVAACVDVKDVDGVDPVEMALGGQRAVGVDDAGVEADAQDGRDGPRGAAVGALPLVVGVPGRIFAYLGRVFVDGCVQIGRAGPQAGFEHRHVDKGLGEVEDDSGTGVLDQADDGILVEGVDRAGVQFPGGILHVAFPVDAGNDLVAFALRPGGDADVAEHIVVLGALVGGHVGDAARAEDQHVVLSHGWSSFGYYRLRTKSA